MKGSWVQVPFSADWKQPQNFDFSGFAAVFYWILGSCMCTAIPFTARDYQRQGWVRGVPNSHLHRGDFPYQVQVCPLVPTTCWFSCLAAPPMDCFSNKLALCAQTVFSKQSLCSPNLRKSAKGLPAQAERSALWFGKVMELCKLSVLHEWLSSSL